MTEEAFDSMESLVVYPNPSTGALNIRLQPESDMTQTIEVYNNMGQKVESFELSFSKDQPNAVISLNDLSDGVYYVRVFDGTTIQNRRVMIKN